MIRSRSWEFSSRSALGAFLHLALTRTLLANLLRLGFRSERRILLRPLLNDVSSVRLHRRNNRYDGYKRHPGQVPSDRRITVESKQRGGDERREPAREHRRQLVAQRSSAVADSRAKELAEVGRLRAIHG